MRINDYYDELENQKHRIDESLRICDFLMSIEDLINKRRDLEPDLRKVAGALARDLLWRNCPPDMGSLRPYQDEDGAVWFEWALPRRRAGVCFEADPKDSGWWYVGLEGKPETHITGSGPIATFEQNVKKMIDCMLGEASEHPTGKFLTV